jgi:hypothetical protein
MMTDSDHDIERAAVGTLKAQLTAVFTEIDTEYIDVYIEQAFRRFDGARIRLYVPLLVEHAVRDHLLTLTSVPRPQPHHAPAH